MERRQVLQELLRTRGLRASVLPFSHTRRAGDLRETGSNIVVDLGFGSRDIVIGAHVDAARLPDGSLSRGMVDNAAGVVVIERVAETLRRLTLRHRVRIVFFDLEESGLLGSADFVASTDRTRVDAMVNVDVAAYGDTVILGPAASAPAAALAHRVETACAAASRSCVRFAAYPDSDDRSFSAAGIPALSLSTVTASEAHQLWLMLNGGESPGLRPGFSPRVLGVIHTRDDTETLLDPAAMTLAYQAVLDLVRDLDRNP
jgi:hypothetical protein